MIELTELQVWTLIGVLAASTFATTGLISTMFTRVLRAEIGGLRGEMNGRFDAVDARFEAVSARFDAVDVRFGAIERRLDGLDRDVQALTKRLFDRWDSSD